MHSSLGRIQPGCVLRHRHSRNCSDLTQELRENLNKSRNEEFLNFYFQVNTRSELLRGLWRVLFSNASTLWSWVRIPFETWTFVPVFLYLCYPMLTEIIRWAEPQTRSPTKCLNHSDFQKMILNWNKPEGLIRKAEQQNTTVNL
jgi:hypothetical protein